MTCSRRLGRLLQASCLGLIGTLTFVGCGGSSGGGGKPDAGTSDTLGAEVGGLPSIKVNPILVPFGTVDVGSKSTTPAPVTVTNVGSAPAALTISVSGPFSIESTTCSSTLAANASCTINLAFGPTAVGIASGTLTVAPNIFVALSGMGQERGSISVTDRVDLGQLTVGQTAPVVVRVTPNGKVTDLSCVAQGADLTVDAANTTCTAAPTAVCTYAYIFKAATAGVKSDSVICAAGTTTKTVPVSATVVTPAQLVMTPPAPLVSAVVGETGSVDIVVANGGGSQSGALTVSPLTGEFSIATNGCTVPLAPLATCKITVNYKPTAAGEKTAILTVTDAGAPAAPLSVTIKGTAVAPGFLTISGTADFGSVALGTSGTPVAFTVKNTGGQAAAGIVITSTDPAQFKIGSDLCSGQTLAATTGACTFTVTFAPAATSLPGILNANITATASTGNPAIATVKGTAITPPTLTLTPNPLAFDGIALNTKSDNRLITVTNTGAADTGAITVPAGLGNGFVIAANNCAASLKTGETCTIGINFTPHDIALASFTLTVTAESGATGSATLTGTGRQPNVLELSPRDVGLPTGAAGWPDTALGQTNGSWPKSPGTAPIRFTITNTNTATANGINLESGPVTVSIDNATEFVKNATNCGPSLAAGQTCYYDVDFKPSAAGKRTGTLTVTSTNGGNTATNLQALGLPALELQPCGNAAPYTAPITTHVAAGPGAGAAAIKADCVAKLASTGTYVGNTNYVKNVDGSIDRTGLAFGNLPLGSSCADAVKVFLVTVNSSTAADYMSLVTSIVTDAATPANFKILDNNGNGGADVNGIAICNNQKLDTSTAPAQCLLAVQFFPQGATPGAKAASITSSGDGGGSGSLNLTGTATGPLAITPATAEFGTVVVNQAGAASTDVTMKVFNWSDHTMGPPVSITLTGDAAGDFRKLDDTCTKGTEATLGIAGKTGNVCHTATESCHVTYRFYPSAVGSRTATFTVTAGTQTSSATLHGTGVPETTISTTPPNVDFASVVMSKKSAWQAVTVTAGSGTYETGALQYAIVGDDTTSFETPTQDADLGTCGRSGSTRLGGSNPTSCTVKVRFIPSATDLGPQKAILVVMDPRDRTLDQHIPLTGIGTTALTISPTSGDFGIVQLNEGLTTGITFTVTNIGDVQIDTPIVTYDDPSIRTGAARWFQGGAVLSSACDAGPLAAGAKCYVVAILGDHSKPGIFAANPGVTVQGQGVPATHPSASSAVATLAVKVQIKADLELETVSQIAGAISTDGSTGATAVTSTLKAINLGAAAINGTGGKATFLLRNKGGHATGPLHFTFYGDQKNGADITNPLKGYSQDQKSDNFSITPPTGETDPDNCFSKVFSTSGLPSGQFCKFEVVLSPTVVGSWNAILQVAGAYSANKPMVPLYGEGKAVGDLLSIAPAFYSFFAAGAQGPVTVGLSTVTNAEVSAEAATPFAVANGYDTDKTIATLVGAGNNLTSIANLGSSTADFYYLTAVPAGSTAEMCPLTGGTVVSGHTCYIWIKFIPQAGSEKFRTGTLSVTLNGVTHNAGMIGKVREGTVLEIWSPVTGTDFGRVMQSATSAAQTYTVMNVGDAATTGGVALGKTGPDAAYFGVTGCGGDLAAFDSNTPSGVKTCAATVTLNPGSHAIGPVGSATSRTYVQATYSGKDAALATLSGATATNADTPAVPSTEESTNNHRRLKGICIKPPVLTLNPSGDVQDFAVYSPLHSGSALQAVGTKSPAWLFTITNGPSVADTSAGAPDTATTAPVTIALTEGSAAATNFILDMSARGRSDSCAEVTDQISGNLILVGNEYCTVEVTFAPVAMPATGAAFNATLTASATGATSGTVAFKGTGRDPLRVSAINDAPRGETVVDPYSFGTVVHGQLSATGVKFTIEYAATEILDSGLLSSAVTGDFVIVTDTCQGVAKSQGGTCDVTVKFAPSTTGARTGTLKVSGTPGGTASINLTGQGS